MQKRWRALRIPSHTGTTLTQPRNAMKDRIGRNMVVPMLATFAAFCIASSTGEAQAANSVDIKVTGDWTIQVTLQASAKRPRAEALLQVEPPAITTVTAEKYDSLPVFNPNTGGWVKGAQLRGVKSQETTTPGLLESESLVLREGPEPTSLTYEKGKDYDADLFWGTFGRLATGRIKEGQPVYASYRHGLLRLDSIVLASNGKIVLRKGVVQPSAPLPAAIETGDVRLANIWLPGRVTKLSDDNLFPILETTYPEPPPPAVSVAEKLIPKTFKKLKSGDSVKILAWGDSVTDGSYVPNPNKNRWQEQFVTRLRAMYPAAKIELVTEAWGGRNTSSYLGEPPGSPHNYREKVLAVKPDLIISEFVNDAGFNPQQVEERYSALLADFKSIGAEWIILTPHYVRADWMGLTMEKDIDSDPRPYVAGLRQFAAKHDVALADAALRYGRLWRQGIPHISLLSNSINHPDPRGMKIFADAIIQLFPAQTSVDSSAITDLTQKALKQISAGKIDSALLTPALQKRLTSAKVKSLAGSLKGFGAMKSMKVVSVKQIGSATTGVFRTVFGDTSFIVTSVAEGGKLDDIQFLEE